MNPLQKKAPRSDSKSKESSTLVLARGDITVSNSNISLGNETDEWVDENVDFIKSRLMGIIYHIFIFFSQFGL